MNDGLRTELVAMFDADQAAVTEFLADADRHRAVFERRGQDTATPWPYALLEWSPVQTAPSTVRHLVALVRRHTTRLRRIVDQHGWPGRGLVGEDGADAAWLLLQHAGSGVLTIGTPDNHAFLRACVPLLERAVTTGDAHPRHLAATVDAVRSVAGLPPMFGVLGLDYAVVAGTAVFRRPVDLAELDRCRARIGLPALAIDVARRAQGEPLDPAGPNRAEPWPP